LNDWKDYNRLYNTLYNFSDMVVCIIDGIHTDDDVCGIRRRPRGRRIASTTHLVSEEVNDRKI